MLLKGGREEKVVVSVDVHVQAGKVSERKPDLLLKVNVCLDLIIGK